MRRGYDTDLGTCVDEESTIVMAVPYIKEATRGGLGRRHLSPLVTGLTFWRPGTGLTAAPCPVTKLVVVPAERIG